MAFANFLRLDSPIKRQFYDRRRESRRSGLNCDRIAGIKEPILCVSESYHRAEAQRAQRACDKSNFFDVLDDRIMAFRRDIPLDYKPREPLADVASVGGHCDGFLSGVATFIEAHRVVQSRLKHHV